MANQRNFVTRIGELALSNTKYMVSRIIDNPAINPLFEVEVPADFLDFDEDYTVEMNVYSLADNVLVYSDVIKNTSVTSPIEIQKYVYERGSRTLIFIDFSKIGGLFLPLGKFRVSFNFFENKLNTSYESRALRISKISPSRREVEVKYDVMTDSNRKVMDDFVTPSIKAADVFDMMAQVFNQTGSQDLKVAMYTSSIDITRLKEVLGPSASAELELYGFDADGPSPNSNNFYTSNLGVYTIAQNILDEAYGITTQSLTTAIELHKSRSFTLNELTGSVLNALTSSYQNIFTKVATQEVKFRFDLI